MPRHWAEAVAKAYLEAQGYILLAENYAVRGGELDLVMQRGETIVFVEVRQRQSARYGSAAESLGARKLGRLRQTALAFLLERFGRDDLPVRFDAVLLQGSRTNYALEHLEGVF